MESLKSTLLGFIRNFKLGYLPYYSQSGQQTTEVEFNHFASWGRYENMDINDLRLAKKYLIK